jgi:hypothetical protein
MLHAFATLVLAISVAGCVTDQVSRRPLGIQEQDWTSMTPEQRLQAHFKQVEVNQAERKQKKQETAPAESRKADVRPGGSFGVAYGDRIQCIGAPLSFSHENKWRKAEDVIVDVSVGTPAEVGLIEAKPVGKEALRRQVFTQFDGKMFWMCPTAGAPSKSACVQLLGTFEDYRRGVSQTIEKPRFVRGRLRCSLGPGDGMPGIVRSAQIINDGRLSGRETSSSAFRQ